MSFSKSELVLHRIRRQLSSTLLRKPALEIQADGIKTNAELQAVISHMRTFLNTPENELIGIAAPQLNYSHKMFLLSERLFQTEDASFEFRSAGKSEVWSPHSLPAADDPRLVFINPQVTKAIGPIVSHVEECISLPQYQGIVPRFSALDVQYLSAEGDLVEGRMQLSAARAFQHELDHLFGTLYCDRLATPVDFQPLDAQSRA